MSRLLRNPKALAIVLFLAFLAILGLAGGALGSEFGLGFIGSPLGHIQLAAEPLTNVLFSFGEFFEFQLTNTMVAAWTTVALLALIGYLVSRRVSDVPGRLQNLVEMVFEFFLRLAESVAGPERARRFLPLVLTIFLFIVTSNWLGILPGFGTIGKVETAEEVIHHAEEREEHPDLSEIHLQAFDDAGISLLSFGSVKQSDVTAANYEEELEPGQTAGLLVPFFRSANTDINTTLALALIAMVMVHWWGLRTLGIGGHLGKYINFKGGLIGFFVGILEGIAEFARLLSFTFRLFGNIFAGEVLLIAIAFLVPLVGIIPFLGLELFVGVIQAFIFAMLTLVFASLATVSHGGAEEHH